MLKDLSCQAEGPRRRTLCKDLIEMGADTVIREPQLCPRSRRHRTSAQRTRPRGNLLAQTHTTSPGHAGGLASERREPLSATGNLGIIIK